MTRAAWTMILALLGFACGPPGPTIQIHEAWSRPSAAPGPGVAYLSIVNSGRRSDRLVAVRSNACRAPEIHRTTVDGDRMGMVHLRDGIEIPAGETVEFRPGGLHLMLNGLHEDLRTGDGVELILQFETHGEVRVRAEVRAP